MYVPDHFRADDTADCHQLMRSHPFAVLVSQCSQSGLQATHLPTVLKPGQGRLGTIEAHFARPNAHWRMFRDSDEDAMLIFSGPQGYIHPGWYPSKAETGKVVPTWNYAAVHAYGRVQLVTDKDKLRRHVAELTDQQEAAFDDPWSLDDAPAEFTDVMLRGIVGLSFEITRLEGKRKMSQNRPEQDRRGVVAGLRATAGAGAAELADMVERESRR